MPMYDYKCPSCGKRFEELVAMDKRDEVVCPACGGQVKRVYEGPCAFGAKKGENGSCSGSCEHCSGCHH